MEGISRDLFPILEKKTHLNTCSAAALSTRVKQAAINFISDWDEFAGVSWVMENKWNDQVEAARSNFAKIIGAKPENIAYMFGNSTAISSIMSSINFSDGDEIIFNELDFPSFPTNIMSRSDHGGVNYRVVKADDGLTVSPDDYREIITDKTRLITACEVVSNTGFRINTEELIELSHERDIPVFLDTYQSTGTIPMDVRKNNVDFMASGNLKYLLGGFGISFLYVRDDWIENLRPGSIGWMGVDNPFADLYDKLRTKLHRPSTATKFQYGTPYPNGAYTANAGMKHVLEIGVEKIYDHNMRLTQEIVDRALDLDYELLTPADKKKRGSIVNFKVDGAIEKVSKMQNDGFILDARAGGIRVSPHFYNNTEDVDKLFDYLTKS
jgi:selenocysteine lyase/cysteine desulfurase